jgi:eukaryotic-like serine/threonine-protein kinase
MVVMGDSGDPLDETRSLAPEPSGASRTAATALLTDPGPPSPQPHSPPAPRRPVPELPAGAKLGRFSVLNKLGAGGMGIVYAAYDPELDRRVAIKLLGYDDARSRDANLRLLREAQAMARLSHPNVVSVYDVGELDDRTVFLAMELVDGQSLDAWVKAAPRTWYELRDVLIHAGRGLGAAHRAGLVHRDFKPGNVLIDADGRARVTDFGIARLEDADVTDDGDAPATGSLSGVTPLAIDLTRTGTAVGTPAYMAPEQHRGQPVDARADQFAFCVTAWEAVWGARPFAGKGAELLAAIGKGAPKPPRDVRDVPPGLAAHLRRGLADAPASRWPSMDELLVRLADDPGARRRRRVAIAASLAVVAALVGVSTFLAARPDDDACGAGDRELAATWNPAARSASEAAFRATDSPLAADHWQRVSAKIDAFATAWTAGRRDACQQHVDHVQSDDLYDRRIACLGRERARLAAFVDLMKTADATLVRESVMVAAALPRPADCADTEALLANRAPPSDAQVREAVTAIGAGVERVNTLRTIGRYKEALELLTSLHDRATKIDYPPQLAELAMGIGMLQGDLSDPAAEASIRKALDLAAAAHDQVLYARVWMMLIWEIGFKRGRYDDALPLRPLAWQAVHLAGDLPEQVATLSMHEGAVDVVHGEVEAATVSLERAVALTEAKYGPNSVHLVASLNLLAVTLGRHEPAKAKVVYERALAILSETVSPNHPRVGGILGNLGGIAMDEGDYAKAIDYHRRALAVTEAALGKDAPDLGPSLNGLAQPLWAMGKWDEAYELIDRARTLWVKSLGPEHPYVAVALSNLGGLRQEQGRCKEGLPLLEEARAIQTKALGKDHPSLAMTLTFLGGCLNELGRSADALPVLEQALAIQTAKGDAVAQAGPRFEIARALWSTGGDKAKALAMAEEARVAIARDPGDKAQAAAGVKSGSAEVAEWLAGKSAGKTSQK